MSVPRTHYAVEARNAIGYTSACGRGRRLADAVHKVDCLLCQTQQAFIETKAAVDAEAERRFWAQEPRQFSEPWRDGVITCGGCGGTMFRDKGRSCYGHYQDYLCAGCGATTSRLTETGMSF